MKAPTLPDRESVTSVTLLQGCQGVGRAAGHATSGALGPGAPPALSAAGPVRSQRGKPLGQPPAQPASPRPPYCRSHGNPTAPRCQAHQESAMLNPAVRRLVLFCQGVYPNLVAFYEVHFIFLLYITYLLYCSLLRGYRESG